MKLIQVSGYYPPSLGGQQNAVREISERLAARGHVVEVFTSDIGCQDRRPHISKNLKVHYLKSWEVAHTPIVPALFFHLLRSATDAIIHVHYGQPFIPEMVRLVSMIRRVPYVAHIHIDPQSSGRCGFLLPLYKRFCFRPFLNRASTVIVLNHAYKKLLKETYHCPAPIEIAANGVGEAFFDEKGSRRNNVPILLFVGRLNRQKNLPRLVLALRLLRHRCFAIIVGDGETKNEIALLIKEQRLKNIYMAGARQGDDLRKAYRAADLFLLTSDNEGAPLVLLEAMASGTPIVASDINGVRELVRDAGILVNPPTPENFAKEIDRMLASPALRAAMAKKGKEKAWAHRWDKTIDTLENVFRGLSRK